jgi:hypothetical protein
MRTFYYAIGAKITRALEGEELVYEGPLYEVLRKWFSPDVNFFFTEELTRGTCELVETQTHSAGIAIYALKSTAIELVLSNLIEDIINLDDSSAVCLHMLVCSGCCYGCAGNLFLFIRQAQAVIR